MAEQPRLFGTSAPDLRLATLLISDANRAAWETLGRWSGWPAGALALCGPEGSGKSHMAHAWAEHVGAGVWSGEGRALDSYEAAGGKIVLDDADRFPDDAHLALLLDAARAGNGAVLMTAREPPQSWPVRLRDLRSRLAAVPVEVLGEPDDALLAGVLARLCKARFIKLTDKAATYLTLHMERSFAAAHAVADALDGALVRKSQPISVPVAVRALRSMGMDAPDADEEGAGAQPENA